MFVQSQDLDHFVPPFLTNVSPLLWEKLMIFTLPGASGKRQLQWAMGFVHEILKGKPQLQVRMEGWDRQHSAFLEFWDLLILNLRILGAFLSSSSSSPSLRLTELQPGHSHGFLCCRVLQRGARNAQEHFYIPGDG